MVGAVLVKGGKVIGRGWHRCAGGPHAEIEALRDAQNQGCSLHGATLYVTLEPCCTHGRTPPCTDAIITAGIRRVVAGAIDPNPRHAGKGFKVLRRAGIKVEALGGPHSRGRDGPSVNRLKADLQILNEAFSHWIVHRTPFVTVKAAMTLDGKIATARGESKWITGEDARAYGMKLRQGNDAVLVGVNTVLMDDPSLTVRPTGNMEHSTPNMQPPRLRRIVLDSGARTPLTAKVVSDEHAALTTMVVGEHAPKRRVAALAKRVKVWVAPIRKAGRTVPWPPRRARSDAPYQQIDLRWLLKRLGSENVTSLLVEGGGEANASFLLGGLAHRVAFFYAPKILGGRNSRPAVAGSGVARLVDVIRLCAVEWRRLGKDLLLLAHLK